MKVFRLSRSQFLPISMNDAWAFFSDPRNLQRITPKEMNFRVLTDLDGESMYAGQIINYKVSPLAGISMGWTTEITHCEDKKYFVDEQRFGPYSFWHHKHFFEETENGIIAKDIVDYGLPFGVIGWLANALFVRNKLNQIFNYREKILTQLFVSPQE
jgi:ligand-binding SRPBCC domain-containing protein